MTLKLIPQAELEWLRTRSERPDGEFERWEIAKLLAENEALRGLLAWADERIALCLSRDMMSAMEAPAVWAWCETRQKLRDVAQQLQQDPATKEQA